ncbi:hypothetical protein FGG08_006932 [Glutinoglossum americanum]|uniref:C2H2-type domain-containing protein n=1 Tax=Glutinoglossum americanum TaxID=1670608 RepID=A0A9P8L0H9_9PEZI|nr:hypothetical protein FGG08_006932 [Glutinoglossum americanum]
MEPELTARPWLVNGNASFQSNLSQNGPKSSARDGGHDSELLPQPGERVRFSRVQGKGPCLHYEIDHLAFSSCAGVTFGTPSAQKHLKSKSCKRPGQSSQAKKRSADEVKRVESIIAAKDWDEIRKAVNRIKQETKSAYPNTSFKSFNHQDGEIVHQAMDPTLTARISLLEIRCQGIEDILAGWDQLIARVRSLEEDNARLEGRLDALGKTSMNLRPVLYSLQKTPQLAASTPLGDGLLGESLSTVDPLEILRSSSQSCYMEGGSGVQMCAGDPPASSHTDMDMDSPWLPMHNPEFEALFGELATYLPASCPKGQPPSELEETTPENHYPDSGLSSGCYIDLRLEGAASGHGCPDCGRLFRQKGDLNRHQSSVHMGWGSGYSCPKPGCSSASKIFRRRDNLRDHLKRIHKPSPEEISTLLEKGLL